MTSRQLEIWALLAQGKSNPEIAAALSIGEKTVKSHCTQLYKALGVKNRTQATIAFLQQSKKTETSHADS